MDQIITITVPVVLEFWARGPDGEVVKGDDVVEIIKLCVENKDIQQFDEYEPYWTGLTRPLLLHQLPFNRATFQEFSPHSYYFKLASEFLLHPEYLINYTDQLDFDRVLRNHWIELRPVVLPYIIFAIQDIYRTGGDIEHFWYARLMDFEIANMDEIRAANTAPELLPPVGGAAAWELIWGDDETDTEEEDETDTEDEEEEEDIWDQLLGHLPPPTY